MPKDQKNSEWSPMIGLLILILLLLLLLLFVPSTPEKERELKEKLQEKKKALEHLLLNIEESKAFKEKLLQDIKKTTIILRWVVFGIMVILNAIVFKFSNYHTNLKDIVECSGIVTAATLGIVNIFFFLRFGKFVEIKNAYHELQLYIMKLRYDKTEEEIHAYLTAQLEDKAALEKEIVQLEFEIKQIEERKALIPPSASNDSNETTETDK